MRNLMKITALVLALCMLLAVPVAAAENGSCGEAVRWSFSGGTLTISGTGSMADYSDPETRPWNHLSNEITAVVIGEGVTTVGMMAFCYLPELQTLTLPSTLEQIGLFSFMVCEKLTELNLPRGLTGIGQQAFFLCTGLTEVTIPGSVAFLDASVFQGCSSLKRAYFEKSTAGGSFVNGSAPFRECFALEEIVVEAGHFALKTVDGILYNYDNEGLSMLQYPLGSARSTLTLPQDTVTINQFAMEGAPVEAIVFPAGFTGFSDFALSSCTSLQTLTFQGDAPYFTPDTLWGDTVTIRYPQGNATWTEEVMQDYSGTVTWTPYRAMTFTDVPMGTFYYEPIRWAVEKGITAGISDTRFGSADSCNRAQAVTFLWSAAGKPEPAATSHPFVDVPKGSFCEKAVLWAMEKGITSGTDATHFGPLTVCNRATIVTFLYKAFESPDVSGVENPFRDIPAKSWYTPAVLWALEEGITSGSDATHFSPASLCNRAQMVTFLYNAYTD